MSRARITHPKTFLFNAGKADECNYITIRLSQNMKNTDTVYYRVFH